MMTRPRRCLAWISVSLILAGVAGFAADKPYEGYLTPGEFEVTRLIEPAPRKGDPRYETDRKIFRATRALLDTPRGEMATSDADASPAALMRDFSCAMGVTLTPQNAPAVLHLISRAGTDTAAQTNIAKDVYKRSRPFHIDRGRICQPKAELGDSFDFPSGHVTRGWTWAYILTELAPDRAQQILGRGRAYGESRFICGAHNESAVQAGRESASATMALVRTKPAYRADLDSARLQLAALRANPASRPPDKCDIEEQLVNQRVMPSLTTTGP